MDITTQKRCLTGLAALLLVGAVGAVAWSISGLSASNDVVLAGSDNPLELPVESESVASVPNSDVAARSLRGPLYPPPPRPKRVQAATPKPIPKPTPPRPPKLELTLVGTIIQSNESVAIISDSSGKFDIKGIGQSLELSPEGVTIENIESEQVTLAYQGRKSTVILDRTIKPGKAKPRGNRRRNQ